MITTLSFRQLKADEYDYCFAITRTTVGDQKGARHLPTLAPSHYLFSKYNNLRLQGRWNKETFEKEYKPVFLSEMKEADSFDWLLRLVDADAKGFNVALVCYCPDKELCHRSLVAELLRKMGANVTEL